MADGVRNIMTRRTWTLWRELQVIKLPQAEHPIGIIRYQFHIGEESALVGKFIQLTRKNNILTIDYQHLVVGEIPPDTEILR